MTRIVRALALLLALAAAPAAAQEPMSGADFEAYTEGKTLLYGTDGRIYGGEDYLPGRKVRWSFLDGRCLDGIWYEAAPNICFVYTDDPDPVCWTFYKGPDGLTALLDGDPDEVLYETGETAEPLVCLGPDVGV